MSAPTRKGVELALDETGRGAFERLSRGLPAVARELAEVSKAAGELGEDLVVVPAPTPADGRPSLADLASDLELLEKVLSGSERARAKRLRMLMNGLGGIEKDDVSTGDLAASGGALVPAQGGKKPKKREGERGGEPGKLYPGDEAANLPYYNEVGAPASTDVTLRAKSAAAKDDGSGTSAGLAAANRERDPKEGDEDYQKGMEVQTVLVPTSRSAADAKKWLADHGYSTTLDVGEDFYRARQQPYTNFEDGSLRTISFGDSGIKAVVGKPKVEKGAPFPKKKPDGKFLFSDGGAATGDGGAGGTSGGAGMIAAAKVSVGDRLDRGLVDWLAELAGVAPDSDVRVVVEDLGKRRRAEMPQIPAEKLDEFEQFLRGRSVATSKESLLVGELKSSQDDLNRAKVERIKANGLEALLKGPPLLAAGEKEILDGHHRAAAIKELDPQAKVSCLVLGCSIDDAIAHALEFPGAEVRGIRDGAAKLSATIVKRADDDATGDEQRTVLGIVLEPETLDSQNDIYSEDEIRESAWGFAERYQHFGLMHRQLVPGVLLLETYLAPVDFVIAKRPIKKGTWLLRVRVMDDSIWEAVKDGRLSGFSIGGSAVRREVKRTYGKKP